MSVNRQLTSNYHDPTAYHIRPLPQYSPYLFLYLCVCLFYFRESLFYSPSRHFVTLMFLPSVKPESN
nr:hypothetical transcript [Hymenolepis microstoma]